MYISNTGGFYIPPQTIPHRCPNCGACPNCGKQLAPWVQPWPGYPMPYVGDVPGWFTSNRIIC